MALWNSARSRRLRAVAHNGQLSAADLDAGTALVAGFQGQAEAAAVAGDHGQDRLGRQLLPGNLAVVVHGPQDPAAGKAGSFAPEAVGQRDSGGDGYYRTDAAVLAARVGDRPVAVALLEVVDGEHGEDGAVAFTLQDCRDPASSSTRVS